LENPAPVSRLSGVCLQPCRTTTNGGFAGNLPGKKSFIVNRPGLLPNPVTSLSFGFAATGLRDFLDTVRVGVRSAFASSFRYIFCDFSSLENDLGSLNVIWKRPPSASSALPPRRELAPPPTDK